MEVVPEWAFEPDHSRRPGDKPDKNKGTTLKANLNYIKRLHEAHYHSEYDRLEIMAVLKESKAIIQSVLEMQKTLLGLGLQPPNVNVRKWCQKVTDLQGKLKKHDYLLDANVWKCLRVEHNPPLLASVPNPTIEHHSTQLPSRQSPIAYTMEKSYFNINHVSDFHTNANSDCRTDTSPGSHTDSNSDFQFLTPIKPDEIFELQQMTYSSMDMGQEQPMFITDDGDLGPGRDLAAMLCQSAVDVPHRLSTQHMDTFIHDSEYGSIDANSYFNCSE